MSISGFRDVAASRRALLDRYSHVVVVGSERRFNIFSLQMSVSITLFR